ncbi:NACHT, LRR and PYD domains-containing protein 12 [Echinops telfairi]|uniref:NACHT, LRR and PYD domains-containing protein 12 n=1 Tax=Echinops telfairi TaxID=9371 RepID=A0ABM0ZTI1_ECHTE|nr:NACHT, LRR and PYD domains-containing protein 12 [Echinops telfairi]
MTECVLCCLATYLEELAAMDLKKFKLYLGTTVELGEGKIPWGRMETAGTLEMAQLLVAHYGSGKAWLLALSIFERINRKDLWERGQREDLVRDARETYLDYIRRKFRLMEDRNARLGECANLSHRYTRLLLVKEHPNPMWAREQLLATGGRHPRTRDQQLSPIQIETLFEPDEERPEPPHTVVLQGAAGMGKSMLAHKVMLDWADGRLFQGRFDFLFYINCREMNQKAQRSLQDLVSSCWPEHSVPLPDLVRVPQRLLFIVDGFDELKPSFHHPQGPWCSRWEEKEPTELLLSSLIRKMLLPESSLLITTRPMALEKLHGLLEHPRRVEILGFCEPERKEYFYKYFASAEQAGLAFNFVRDNEPLFTMCFVPMVCWVVCTCLKQQLEVKTVDPEVKTGDRLQKQQPLKTLAPGLPERDMLPNAYSEHLAAALATNPNLMELVLYRNALGSRGVRLLCQGLRHPNCQLQNLRLKKCRVSAAACDDLAAAVAANQSLRRLDLSNNSLGLPGMKLLSAGLRHPGCRLQKIQLRKCQLEAGACEEISSALCSNQHLVELDLTGNALEDVGLRLLCQGLKHPMCRLQTLWLKICRLTVASCGDLASALQQRLSLRELDLSLNDLGDPGVLLLCEGLQHPNCKLQTLRVDSCGLTAQAGEDLSSALAANQTLTELYLTNNALRDAGVQLLCHRLSHPGCKLRVLWLFGMDLNRKTHRALAMLRVKKPDLDIGC